MFELMFVEDADGNRIPIEKAWHLVGPEPSWGEDVEDLLQFLEDDWVVDTWEGSLRCEPLDCARVAFLDTLYARGFKGAGEFGIDVDKLMLFQQANGKTAYHDLLEDAFRKAKEAFERAAKKVGK